MGPISRRNMIAGLVAGGASLSLVRSAALAANAAPVAQENKMPLAFKNEDFYTADGKFNPAAAKEAYYAMMKSFGYPIPPRLKTDDFWTLDFGLGKFTECGMAGIFWVNHKEHNYFGHEIYLLPGQMIPEHQHVKTEFPAKLEGWQPRYGMIYIFGEGTPTPGVEQHIPPLHREIAKARKMAQLQPGEVAGLAKAEEWHFMKAGPQGAIVTEYATYHDMAGLRFTHPKCKL